MKGTFFSADFIKDSSNSIRLLELNTDTAMIPEQIPLVDWQPFIDILSANNLTDIHVIYKPFIHSALVTNLSDALASSGITGLTVTLHDQDQNTIYPSSVEDSESKFILRLAYDESAIFDSEYCKERLNVYTLFYNDYNDYVAEFYYSSSNGVFDSLSRDTNPSNIPDVSVKDTNEIFNPIDFYKLGHNELSDIQRWDGFITENKADNKIIEQFHFHSSSLDNETNLSSYRGFFIVYGSNLDTVNIHSYRNTTILELPEDISSEVDNSVYGNKLADHHYYEYTTNTFKVDGAGLLSTDKIQMSDNTYKSLGEVEVGEQIKSFFISGSPQVENDLDTMNWSYEGNSFPSGSFLTSSYVVFKNVEKLHYNALVELVVGGDSQFSGASKQYLIYDSGSNTTRYKHVVELDPTTDYLYDFQGNLIDLDEVYYYVTSDSDVQIVELDVEDTDTYIISSSTAFNAVVSHNNPCFIAGTQVSLPDGTYKNIEDVAIGEEVVTYNFDLNVKELRKVQGLTKKQVNSTVKYTFNDGTVLQGTHDHPLYSQTKGWVSRDPSTSLKKYNLPTDVALVGDPILRYDGSTGIIQAMDFIDEPTLVYNLVSIEANHNYYANEFLVHNRCFVAGTKIALLDGSFKEIQEVKIGDEVLSFNEELGINEAGVVGDLKQHEVEEVIRITLDNEIIILTTHEHPFYTVDKGWIKAKDLEPLDVCKKLDGSEALISTVEILKESHTVFNLLNVSENHNFYANEILVHNK